MHGKTREEAVLILLGLREHVSLLVQHRRAGENLHFQFFCFTCMLCECQHWRDWQNVVLFLSVVSYFRRVNSTSLCVFFAEYDKLMAEGGTGDFFFIRYVLAIIFSVISFVCFSAFNFLCLCRQCTVGAITFSLCPVVPMSVPCQSGVVCMAGESITHMRWHRHHMSACSLKLYS